MKSSYLRRNKKEIKLALLFILFLTFYQSNNYNSSVQSALFVNYANVSVSEAYNLIDNTSDLFILDVRTEEEYSVGHINYSYLLPYTEIESRQNELPEDKTQPILVYCRSGRRSAIASETLAILNFTQVFNMLDGFSAWLEANYPYETSGIDQTQDLLALFIDILIISIFLLAIFITGGILIRKKNQ